MKNRVKCIILPVVLFLLLAGCASVKELIEEPEILDTSVTLTGLSFQDVQLELNLQVLNPNKISITLGGYGYNFSLAGSPLFSGHSDEGITLGAESVSSLKIPLTIRFRDLYDTYENLEGADEADYRIESQVLFTLPVLGEVTVEADKEGTIPLVKPPIFHFESLYVTDLGIMGADILVRMTVENPNVFEISQKDFRGALFVNDRKWADLSLVEPLELAAGGKSDCNFKIRLEFLSMGRTVRDLLSGEKALYYRFPGEVVLEPIRELMGIETLTLDLNGEIQLCKPDTTAEGEHSSVKIENSIEDNLLNLFGAYSP